MKPVSFVFHVGWAIGSLLWSTSTSYFHQTSNALLALFDIVELMANDVYILNLFGRGHCVFFFFWFLAMDDMRPLWCFLFFLYSYQAGCAWVLGLCGVFFFSCKFES
ncbi:hypothetical protein Dimus_004233 [Dionaea muscipula]